MVRPPKPLWTHSGRWREEISVGDSIEVRESTSQVQNPKWFRGIVQEVGGIDDSPQVIIGGAQLEKRENGVSKGNNGTGTKKHSLLLLERTQQVCVLNI